MLHHPGQNQSKVGMERREQLSTVVLKGFAYVGVSLCRLCESSVFGVRTALDMLQALSFLRVCWLLSP